MPLFTVIVDFGGGTYIGQADAPNPQSAATQWLANQSDNDLKLWRLGRLAVENIIEKKEPIELDGLTNVWCITGSIRNRLFLVNVVQTVRSEVNSD